MNKDKQTISIICIRQMIAILSLFFYTLESLLVFVLFEQKQQNEQLILIKTKRIKKASLIVFFFLVFTEEFLLRSIKPKLEVRGQKGKDRVQPHIRKDILHIELSLIEVDYKSSHFTRITIICFLL